MPRSGLEACAPHPELGDATAAAAVSAVHAAMQAHEANYAVIYYAFGALAAGTVVAGATAKDTLFTPALIAGSCTAALLAALRKHHLRPALQLEGLRALAFVLSRSVDGGPAVETPHGAAKIAVAALLHHSVDFGVVQHACAVLRACLGAKCSVALACVVHSKTVLILLHAAALHHTNETLVVHALESAALLLGDSRFAEACMEVPNNKCSGLDLLLRVLIGVAFPPPTVTHACLSALAALVQYPCVAATTALRQQVIQAVAKTLCGRRFPEAPEDVAIVFQRLSLSTSAQRMSPTLVSSMATILTLVVVRNPWSCSPTYLVHVFSLFAHFGGVESHRRGLFEADALRAVVEGMRRWSREPLVQKAGCEALVAFCPRTHLQNVRLAVAAGAREVVDAASAEFPEGSNDISTAKAVAAALEMLKQAPGPAVQAPQQAGP